MNLPPVCQQEGRASGEQRPDLCPLSSEQYVPPKKDRDQDTAPFHCGLTPREIVHFCQDEFPQIEEVYHLRRTIADRLLRHADLLRWRLGEED